MNVEIRRPEVNTREMAIHTAELESRDRSTESERRNNESCAVPSAIHCLFNNVGRHARQMLDVIFEQQTWMDFFQLIIFIVIYIIIIIIISIISFITVIIIAAMNRMTGRATCPFTPNTFITHC